MKKTALFLVLVVALATVTVFANTTNNTAETSVRTAAVGGSFKLINNSGGKVSIHTGTGFVSLNKGSSTSVGCNVGKKVTLANSGRKGRTLFTISSSMCGKTIKLADYL